ncbi:MAG TPA: ABC transporter permease [Actinoplanes sp.]|nr:ABC transporter permease [Actinoplanes sp.]
MTMTVQDSTTSTAVEAPRPRSARRKAAPSGSMSPGRRTFVWAARIVLVVGFVALWEVAGRREWVDTTLYGQPSGIWEAMKEYYPSDRAEASAIATGKAIFLSFVIGSVAGTLAGLALGLSKTLNAIFGPFLVPINSIPRIALAPLFITWFGLTTTSKVVLAITIVFFILAENARGAVRSVDADLMVMGRVAGLRSLGLLWKVVLPSAVPTLFAGLRLTFTYSLLGVVASEMIAATNGVGQDIVLFSSSYQVDTVFAILVALVIFAVVVNAIFSALEQWLLRWQET